MNLNYLKKILGLKYVEPPKDQGYRPLVLTGDEPTLSSKPKPSKNQATSYKSAVTKSRTKVDEGVPVVTSQTSYSPGMELYAPTITLAEAQGHDVDPTHDMHMYSGGGGSFGGGGSSSSWDSGSSSSSSYDSGSSSSDSGSSSFSND